VRKGQDSLKSDLDRVLDELKPEITTLANKYGFPLGRPVSIDRQGGMRRSPEHGVATLQLVQAEENRPIRLGRSLFNQHCSHCHAPNAMSPEPTRDLRRLALRYGARMRETAYTTITVGRIDKGMPAWKDLLGEEGIQNVIGFLESVQRVP
jgi:mono/diheme cytochrome c family protein